MTLSPASEDLGGQLQPFSKIKSFGKETVMGGKNKKRKNKNKLPFAFPYQLAEMILNPFPVS